MHVLVIGKFSPGQFAFHIADTLNDMGHRVFEFEPSLRIKYSKTVLGRRIHQFNQIFHNNLLNTQTFRKTRKNKLSKIIEKGKIDLTISTHDFLYPDEVKLIREMTDSPIVMWFPDAIGYANKYHFILADYSIIFFQDPYIVNILQKQYNKANAFYLPECCNPKYHKSLMLNQNDLDKYGCDISTYGSPHNLRSFIFSQLLDYGYNIKIWGPKPPIWLNNEKVKILYKGEYVYHDEKVKAVLASKINLNTLVPGGVYGLNARTYEIAGIGGFQIMHWRLGLSDLFEDGKEIVSFNNFDELINKTNHYLNCEKERAEIAISSQRKAHSIHTYAKRLTLIFDTIEKKENGYPMPQLI
jgi:spore maturation protein CgeB